MVSDSSIPTLKLTWGALSEGLHFNAVELVQQKPKTRGIEPVQRKPNARTGAQDCPHGI